MHILNRFKYLLRPLISVVKLDSVYLVLKFGKIQYSKATYVYLKLLPMTDINIGLVYV